MSGETSAANSPIKTPRANDAFVANDQPVPTDTEDSESGGSSIVESRQGTSDFRTSYEPSIDSEEERRRKQLCEYLKDGDTQLDWRDHSEEELMHFLERAKQASEVRRFGYEARWQDHSLDELHELTERAKLCNYLQEQGYQFHWRKPAMPELRDVALRVGLAQKLAKMEGFLRDWRNHDVESLVQLTEEAEGELARQSIRYSAAEGPPPSLSAFRERRRPLSNNP